MPSSIDTASRALREPIVSERVPGQRVYSRQRLRFVLYDERSPLLPGRCIERTEREIFGGSRHGVPLFFKRCLIHRPPRAGPGKVKISANFANFGIRITVCPEHWKSFRILLLLFSVNNNKKKTTKIVSDGTSTYTYAYIYFNVQRAGFDVRKFFFLLPCAGSVTVRGAYPSGFRGIIASSAIWNVFEITTSIRGRCYLGARTARLYVTQ